MLRGDMKLVVGSYSVLRRRHDKRQTVFLYNVTEDSNELFDLRYYYLIALNIEFKLRDKLMT